MASTEHFSLRVTSKDTIHIIISVSKKVSKKAVVRNTIKRRVRSILRELTPNLKSATYMFIAKPGAENLRGEKLKNELKSLVVSCML